MKAIKTLKLTGILLLGVVLTNPLEASISSAPKSTKNVITLTVDKPVIEYMAKTAADQIEAADIYRMQKMAFQIDHLTISFADPDASDYVFRFKPIDEQGLEAWMFSEGYLKSAPENDAAPLKDISARIERNNNSIFKAAKRDITLTLDKPIIDFLIKIYDNQMNAGQIVRLQKLCSKIDHVTVSFIDKTASDYVLKFKQLDNQGLEEWMFREGYIIASPEVEEASTGTMTMDSLFKLLN